MHAEPQKEHQWLEQLVGEWTMESECDMGPDNPSMKSQGTESVRSLGGLWVLCEGRGDTPDGQPATMMMTLGYDPAKKSFVGTFIASMMTHLWLYEGELDSTGKILTLNAEGPSFAGDGTMAQYKDVIEIKSNDHRLLTSHMLDAEGNWQQFMTAHYRRTK